MEKIIEIPEGYEARIEGNKVVLELKESEDEKIRKDLITFICQFAPEHLKVQYVAYLEKQKEPECREPYCDLTKLLVPPGFNDEQKPAERRKEEAEIVRCLKGLVADFVRDSRGAADVAFYQRCIDWIERRSADWSEEDDGMWADVSRSFNDLKMYIQGHPVIGCGDVEVAITCLDEQIAWLRKMLTRPYPQSHWKPSAEQMEWLEMAVKFSTKKKSIHEVILSLYNDLKKLM